MTNNTSRSLRLDDDQTVKTGVAISLNDGQHKGVIKNVYGEQSEEGFKYLQLELMPHAEKEMTLRHGCPFDPEKPITPNSRLGKLLLAFGVDITPGTTLSIRQMRAAMEGKEVLFMTMNKPGKRGGNFANIVEDSIKPASKPGLTDKGST